MARAPITLLDLALTNGDNVASVVNDVTTVAPEWATIPAVTRMGISYDVLRTVGLPHGYFRPVGDGVPMDKSDIVREAKPMFPFETFLEVGEDVVEAQTSQSKASLGDILTREASNNITGSGLYMGTQTWYGQNWDANGFFGLASQVSAGGDLDAGGGSGGTTATTSSAYFLWLDADPNNPQGVHYVVGRQGAMNFKPWMLLPVYKGNTVETSPRVKRAMAWFSNFLFYLALAPASAYSVFRIKNIDAAHPLTDALAAQLVSLIPLGRRNNLRCFINRAAAFTLQSTRGTVTPVGMVGGGGIYPGQPTEVQGIPITVTDSLVSTEINGNLI
jgi:hypothetical protein